MPSGLSDSISENNDSENNDSEYYSYSEDEYSEGYKTDDNNDLDIFDEDYLNYCLMDEETYDPLNPEQELSSYQNEIYNNFDEMEMDDDTYEYDSDWGLSDESDFYEDPGAAQITDENRFNENFVMHFVSTSNILHTLMRNRQTVIKEYVESALETLTQFKQHEILLDKMVRTAQSLLTIVFDKICLFIGESISVTVKDTHHLCVIDYYLNNCVNYISVGSLREDERSFDFFMKNNVNAIFEYFTLCRIEGWYYSYPSNRKPNFEEFEFFGKKFSFDTTIQSITLHLVGEQRLRLADDHNFCTLFEQQDAVMNFVYLLCFLRFDYCPFDLFYTNDSNYRHDKNSRNRQNRQNRNLFVELFEDEGTLLDEVNEIFNENNTQLTMSEALLKFMRVTPLSFTELQDIYQSSTMNRALVLTMNEYMKTFKILCKKCKSPFASTKQRFWLDSNSNSNTNYSRSNIFLNASCIIFRMLLLHSMVDVNIEVAYQKIGTFFADYRWSYLCCKKCSSHLGWHYQHETVFPCKIIQEGYLPEIASFYGVIIKKCEYELEQ